MGNAKKIFSYRLGRCPLQNRLMHIGLVRGFRLLLGLSGEETGSGCGRGSGSEPVISDALSTIKTRKRCVFFCV